MRILLTLVLSCQFIFGLRGEENPSFSPSPLTFEKNQEALLNDTLNFAHKHQKFRELVFKQNEGEFIRLIKEGQNPKMLFIGCSDSRVVPELILNANPGDLFVIRTAGNFVPPLISQSFDGVSATIQYAVEVLNIPHIIVCGHSHCGAIRGLFQELDPKNLGLVQNWIKLGEEAKRLTLQIATSSTPKEEIYGTAEEINVLIQLEHLLTFPFVKKGVQEGRILLHGWYFNVEKGKLFFYDNEKNRFVPFIESYLTHLAHPECDLA
ncbi:MAG: carbonic anhydrase [Parachlamydiaceae bacterium]